MNIHNQYDKDALIEINQWKYKKPNLFNNTLKLLHSPVNYTSDLILKTPIVGEILQEVIKGLLSMNGLLSICNKGAQFSVRHNSIFREYREKGFLQIQEHVHIHHLNLNDVDTVVGWLGAKYKSLSTAEGAATGVKGFAGLAFDIPALIFMNLGAVGEYVTYYGYDITKQEERIFSLCILSLTVADDIEKENVLRTLSDLVKQIKAQPL
ncbi:unnamed protein product [Commensalibacter communis]|nr:unnamed protein product [Commensalibacter communis]